MLETALALPLFLLFILIGIELLRVTYIKLSLHFVLSEAARRAVVAATSSAAFGQDISNRLDGLGLKGTAATDILTVCEASGPCPQGTVNMGARGSFMIFRLEKRVPLLFLSGGSGLFAGGEFVLRSQYLGRNEPM